MATILAQKAGGDSAVAKSDDHHDALAADPSISQFPQGSSYGTTTTSTSGASTFGAPAAGGFGSPSSFGSPTPGFNSTPGGFGSTSFGGTTNSMGSVGTSNMNVSTGNQPVLTGAGSNAAQDADVLVANDNTDWINKKWRPVMGWMYMVVCVCDFTLFPILWSLLQALSHGQVTSQWQPVTLQGAGLFHVAMGAVLGIAAYGRTKEKIEGKS
jgi:Holin of 3TMs, for gene-transfer release